MQTYSLLRAFADSWMLLALTLVFIAVILWAFRPGSRKTHDAVAASIFRNEARPAPVVVLAETAPRRKGGK